MYIGIDLGTSSVKTILIDYNQNILASSSHNISSHSPKDGYSEQNPNEWIDATHKCFQKIQEQKPKEYSDTISIGISGHMHGATIVNDAGNVIRPCILWNDTRSFEECLEFENQIDL